jgi:nucleolar complex protein 2
MFFFQVLLRYIESQGFQMCTINNSKNMLTRSTYNNITSLFNFQKAYQRVYDWQYIFCLELWTSVICTYGSDTDFKHLAYPLAQILQGVATLVPTVRYFPLRLRCIRMLNRIASATGTFIPVPSLLLDILEMEELRNAPTGGVGKAINLLSVK